MHKEITIVADTNDADYIEKTSAINDEDLTEIINILKIVGTVPHPIKGFSNHNWETGEYARFPAREMYKDVLTEEQIELMCYYIPYGEYGIHTIKNVYVKVVIHVEKLF